MRKHWVIIILATVLPSLTQAQEWTRFRGPNGQGRIDASGIPIQWTETNYAWKTTLPNEGHSSPVIWADKVFITCSDKSKAIGTVLALDATAGQILWQKEYQLTKYPMNALNTYASSTPTVDEEAVYVLWTTTAQFTLVKLDHEGKELWVKEYGPIDSKHGPCISPILYQDMVIFTQESRDNKQGIGSRWLAVNKKDGAIRWQIKRDPANAKNDYMTPCVYTDPTGKEQLIFSSQCNGITGVDPTSGNIVWEVPLSFKGRTISSPVLAGDLVIASGGAGASGKVLAIVKAGTSDQAGEILHRIETGLAPFIPTTLVINNRLYTFHDGGTIACWDVQNGKTVWQEETKSRFYGSPIAVGERIYCINTKGEVLVLQSGDTFKLLATNPLGEKSQATPAVANGKLYLRTLTSLICLPKE
ncbi:PQQ-binding-like beta-propeller repeat protein [Planctomycetota bacterium]